MMIRSIELKKTAAVFLAVFSIYLLSSLPVLFRDTFHHYVYLARAFSEGKLNLRLPARGVHEFVDSFDDIAVYRHKFYLGLPPAPAIFILPFIPWRGVHTNARLITVFLGAINAALLYSLLGRYGYSRNKRLWLTALFALGTVHWFVATHGGAWYLAQICGVFFLLTALLTISHPLAAGLLLGGAFLSRQLTVLTFPVFLALLARSNYTGNQPLISPRIGKKWIKFTLGLSGGIGLYLIYNYLRFGDILQPGYIYHNIRGAALLQFERYGLFHLYYLPRNLYTILFQGPKLINHFPYFIPTIRGQAFIFTTPAFFYAFKAKGPKTLLTSIWFSAGLIFLIQLFYCNNGSWQFGYRFILDILPLLIILIARGTPDTLPLSTRAVFIISILFNLGGVIFLRNLL